jgi:hypothetical protein
MRLLWGPPHRCRQLPPGDRAPARPTCSKPPVPPGPACPTAGAARGADGDRGVRQALTTRAGPHGGPHGPGAARPSPAPASAGGAPWPQGRRRRALLGAGARLDRRGRAAAPGPRPQPRLLAVQAAVSWRRGATPGARALPGREPGTARWRAARAPVCARLPRTAPPPPLHRGVHRGAAEPHPLRQGRPRLSRPHRRAGQHRSCRAGL